MGEWIPVSERLPESGTPALVMVKDGYPRTHIETARYTAPNHAYANPRFDALRDGRFLHVTHWMPLPEPPHA